MTLATLKKRASQLGIVITPAYEEMLWHLVRDGNMIDFICKSTNELIKQSIKQKDFFILHESGTLDKEEHSWDENILGVYRLFYGKYTRYVIAFPMHTL